MNMKLTKVVSGLLPFLFVSTAHAFVPGGTLDPTTIPKYVTPLVIPPVMNNNGTANNYDIAVRQFKQQILPGGIWNTVNGRTDAFPPTTVWSYGPANDPLPNSRNLGGAALVAPAPNSQFNYPAYTIEAKKNTEITVNWHNQLVRRPDRCGTATEQPNDCKYIPHILPVDQTLHWANPKARCTEGAMRTDCHGTLQTTYLGPVPMVPHVHGAHTDASYDGYPEAWWMPAASNITCVPRKDPTNPATLGDNGPVRQPLVGEYVCDGTLANQLTNRAGGTQVTEIAPGIHQYHYLNDQDSTTLWYHDHSLGLTRVNVYAGPAGFWLLRDPSLGTVNGENGLLAGSILPYPAPVAGETLATTNFPASLGGSRHKYREIPLAIQDRSFNADGSLFYPDNRAFFEGLNLPGTALDPAAQFPGAGELVIKFAGNRVDNRTSDIAPIWQPEAFFNTMVVNGSTWPVHEVAPALYRFRLLNGTDSRWLNLSLHVVDPATNEPTGTVNRTYFTRDPITLQLSPALQPTSELYFWAVGTEEGLLPQPVAVKTGFATRLDGVNSFMDETTRTITGETAQPNPLMAMLISPAERTDVVIDFRGLPHGTVVRMLNTAPDAPFGGFDPLAPDLADPLTTGQVMQFVVNSTLQYTSPSDEVRDPVTREVINTATAATSPWNLGLSPINALPDVAVNNTQSLALIEEESALACVYTDPISGSITQLAGEVPIAGVCQTVNAVPMAPKAAVVGTYIGGVQTITLWSDTTNLTNPQAGNVEDWTINNFTADAHPIHIHLVHFEVKGRGLVDSPIGTSGTIPTVDGTTAWENGLKDTVTVYPGEFATVRANFDIAGLYVWHCHIIEHEDNEMMAPFCVGTIGTDCPLF